MRTARASAATADAAAVLDEAFEIAARHLPQDEIVTSIEKWIKDDKAAFLIEAVEHQWTSLADIAQALERYDQFADARPRAVARRPDRAAGLARAAAAHRRGRVRRQGEGPSRGRGLSTSCSQRTIAPTRAATASSAARARA